MEEDEFKLEQVDDSERHLNQHRKCRNTKKKKKKQQEEGEKHFEMDVVWKGGDDDTSGCSSNPSAAEIGAQDRNGKLRLNLNGSAFKMKESEQAQCAHRLRELKQLFSCFRGNKDFCNKKFFHIQNFSNLTALKTQANKVVLDEDDEEALTMVTTTDLSSPSVFTFTTSPLELSGSGRQQKKKVRDYCQNLERTKKT